MLYEHSDLGFSTELPDRWSYHSSSSIPPVILFYGPNNNTRDTDKEFIQLQISTIQSEYKDPESRMAYLSEEEATVSRTIVGDEQNVVVLERRPHLKTEMSIVRFGIHYNLTYTADLITKQAIEYLKTRSNFGSCDQTVLSVRKWIVATRPDFDEQAIKQTMEELGFTNN